MGGSGTKLELGKNPYGFPAAEPADEQEEYEALIYP